MLVTLANAGDGRRRACRCSAPDYVSSGARRGTIVRFNFDVLSRVWVASGLTTQLLQIADTAEICCFIARWYAEHVRSGGASDPVYDELIKQLLSEKDSTLRILPA